MRQCLHLLVVLVTLAAGTVAINPAAAESAETGTGADREVVERLIEKLDDPAARDELKAELRALVRAEGEAAPAPAPARGLGGRVLDAVDARVGAAGEQLDRALAAARALPGALAELAAQARDPETLQRWGGMLARLAATLAAGAVASWLTARLLRRPRAAVADKLVAGLGLRAIYLLGRTVLDLVPIAAFAAAAYAVLPALGPREGARLVALTLVNAHVLAAVTLVVVRFVLVPHAPALRLVPLSDAGALEVYRWLRGVLTIGVYGFFLLEAAGLLGMPAAAQDVVMKLLGLALTILAIRFVLRHRREVAAALRREPADAEQAPQRPRIRLPRAVGAARARFADVWHLLASAVLAALFLTWVLEVPGGFGFLAHALVLTALVVVGAQLAMHAATALLAFLFRRAARWDDRLPGLSQRSARYEGPVRRVLTTVIGVLAVLAVLHVWGLGTLGWLTSPGGSTLVADLVSIAAVVAVSFAVWEAAVIAIERALARESDTGAGASTRKQTLLPLARNVVRIALTLIAAMIVLSQIGLDIGPLLAGAGVFGLALGFGAQSLVRDVITGGFILMENAVSVGDWIEAGGHSGEVEGLTIRTVTLRDLAGTVHVVPFGDVTSVTNYNRGHGYALIDAGVAYRERTEEVVRLLHQVAEELRADAAWSPFILGELEVFGLNALGDSAVEIRVRLKTKPLKQFAVKRAFLERMKRVFDENGVEIPFPHRTIYFGIEKDGSAPPVRVARDSAAAGG